MVAIIISIYLLIGILICKISIDRLEEDGLLDKYPNHVIIGYFIVVTLSWSITIPLAYFQCIKERNRNG